MSTKINLDVQNGADFYRIMTVVDNNKNIIDLSTYTIEGQIRKSYSETDYVSFDIIKIDPVIGKISIGLTNQVTNTLTASKYVYDIEITSATGVKYRIAEGLITTSLNVTLAIADSPITVPTDTVSLEVLASPIGSTLVGTSLSTTGAVTRTVASKLNDVISVKDFDLPNSFYLNNSTLLTSNGFWTDDSIPGNLLATQSRLLLGGAIVQNGAKSPGIQKSWVGYSAGGYLTYFDSRSQFASYSKIGAIGIAAASQSSDSLTGENTSIGVASYVNNNNTDTTNKRYAWAYYGHAANTQSNYFTTSIELDTCSTQTLVSVTPYLTGVSGTTATSWIGVGGETAQQLINAGFGATLTNVSCAIGVINSASEANNNRFAKGIVFAANAIAGTDGATGVGTAVSLAKGHRIEWMSASSNTYPSAFITSSSTAVNNGFGIDFQTSSVWFTSNNALALTIESGTGSIVNYLRLIPASTTNAPGVFVAGTDTNIDLLLSPKGTGVIKLGYNTSSVTTPSAFSASAKISIKDSSGNVWYIPVTTTAW